MLFLSANTKKEMFPPGLEPRTFRVLGERDNHYTTETRPHTWNFNLINYIQEKNCTRMLVYVITRHRSTSQYSEDFKHELVISEHTV